VLDARLDATIISEVRLIADTISTTLFMSRMAFKTCRFICFSLKACSYNTKNDLEHL